MEPESGQESLGRPKETAQELQELEKTRGSKQANGAHFLGLESSKTALEGPRWHPKGVWKAPSTRKRGVEKREWFWTTF